MRNTQEIWQILKLQSLQDLSNKYIFVLEDQLNGKDRNGWFLTQVSADVTYRNWDNICPSQWSAAGYPRLDDLGYKTHLGGFDPSDPLTTN